MSRIVYTAEIFKDIDWKPYYSNTPNNFERSNNIYYFDVTQDLTSYWVTTWGGTFDTPDNNELQLFLGV